MAKGKSTRRIDARLERFAHMVFLFGIHNALLWWCGPQRARWVALPANIRKTGRDDEPYYGQEILAAAGFKFHPFPGDIGMRWVELPRKWSLALFESKGSHLGHRGRLLDGKGRERAVIHYDPSFRFVSLKCRYSFDLDDGSREKAGGTVGIVLDRDAVIHRTKPHSFVSKRGESRTKQGAWQEAKRWLDKNRPDWKNPGAYWD